MKVLLENLLRFEDGQLGHQGAHPSGRRMAEQQAAVPVENEIAYRPARVLMQDFTGVPAVVDLAAMRDAMVNRSAAILKRSTRSFPSTSSSTIPSSSMNSARHRPSPANVELEYQRNGERYRFLKWGQQAFKNFRVVPPGTGICHQVNLEYLGQTVWTKEEDGVTIAYPDTCVGTDSHTTMINGLGVLGWGVGGIEAEAAMLGQPVSMLLPEVIGFKLTGKLKEGVTATDLVLTVVQMLRKKGVVSASSSSSSAPAWTTCRSPIARPSATWVRNTARPAASSRSTAKPSTTCTMSGRTHDRIALVEAYSKAQGMWREGNRSDLGVHRHAGTRPRRRRAVDGRTEASGGPHRARRHRVRFRRHRMDA